ncbi:MAG TPA: hypothetical protein EYP58_02185 [bacterium (Candidatus Stahlbacteria)]|nr:hypothetical protein [Candidatus Stahlbacteria bacterium]
MRRVAALLLILSSVSLAQGIRISGSSRTEYWIYSDSLNEHLEERLILGARYKDLRLSTTLFAWDTTRTLDPYRFLDYLIEYKSEDVNFGYGSFYQTFGRGLILRAYFDEDFKREKKLKGLKAGIHKFNSSLMVLSARSRNLFFEENLYVVKNDTTDELRGANLDTRIKLPYYLTFIPDGNINIGLGGSYIRMNQIDDMSRKAFTEIYGGRVQPMIGPIDLYVEYAQLLGTRDMVGGRIKGSGLYSSATITSSGIGITGEYMRYDSIGYGGFGYRYNDPPTPIRQGASANRGMDEVGWSGSVDISPLSNVHLEGSVGNIEDTPGRVGAFEITSKLKAEPNDYWVTEAYYERHIEKRIDPTYDRKTSDKPGFEITYSWNMSDYFDLGYAIDFINEDGFKYNEQTLEIGYGRSPNIAFALRYTLRSRLKFNRITSEELVEREHLGTNYGWLIFEAHLDLSRSTTLRLAYGGEKGGLVCSGGVPPSLFVI